MLFSSGCRIRKKHNWFHSGESCISCNSMSSHLYGVLEVFFIYGTLNLLFYITLHYIIVVVKCDVNIGKCFNVYISKHWHCWLDDRWPAKHLSPSVPKVSFPTVPGVIKQRSRPGKQKLRDIVSVVTYD